MPLNFSYDELKILLSTLDTYLSMMQLDDSIDPSFLTPFRLLYDKILLQINSLDS